MTIAASFAPVQNPRAIEGIACVVAGMWLFVGQDMLIKELLGAQPLWMLIFTRACVSVAILGPLIACLGEKHRFFTALWPIHLVRAALFTSGFAMFYAAFPFMGLAEVSTIFFSAPLFTAVLAALFLGERMGRHRIGALAVGFLGMLTAMAPGHGSFQWVALLPLLCALFYATSMVLTRRVGDGESSLTMSLWTIGFSGLLIWPIGWLVNTLVPFGPEFHHLRLEFVMPDGAQLTKLTLLGLVGMGGYILVNRAYQVASASLIAPFDYSYLPFAAVAAYLFWGEVPELRTLAGMTLIVGAGLYLGYRELQAARRAKVPAPVAETVFATGFPAIAEDTEDSPARGL
ncbi:DMT family transporter [Rhodobacteraceae bacterium B1Z28]|uniref:DMT family transporter n=1 Tax=Ruegeria haliotis TaxID=2747601 RepID=A0ABX2PV79_9RHOB|nr:DMT family transporter [Ruegeria haliotis]NVO58077.1 DMT family transporter [Ruegeria haliotis]